MRQFSIVTQTFNIQENSDIGEIAYSYQPVQINSSNAALDKLDFDHFIQVFHVKTHHINTYLTDIQQRVEAFEETQKQYYNSVRSTAQQLITSITNASVHTFKQTVDNIMREKTQGFKEDMNQTVDEMLQDVYVASEQANNTLLQTTEKHMKEFNEQLKHPRNSRTAA
jgi:isopentenyl diphosphate isomerase/L-lactate dehydrogenase-like FMN-dependent dehydrogenase